MPDLPALLCIGLLAGTAFVAILWLTPLGAGVSPDSIVYLEAAKNLLAGKGYFARDVFVTHFPPLYSSCLAALAWFGASPFQAARYLGAFLLGLNAALLAGIVYAAAGRSLLAALAAGLLFCRSDCMLQLHSMVYSEPLFLAWALACIGFLLAYSRAPSRLPFLASALCAGLALLTRYVGIAFLPAAALVVYLAGAPRPRAHRIRQAAGWLLLACAPLAALLFRNLVAVGSATHRKLAFHPASWDDVKRLFIELQNFVIPLGLPAWSRTAGFWLLTALFLGGLFLLFRGRGSGPASAAPTATALSLLCVLFIGAYLLFLFVSISFFDAQTSVDKRLLSPVFVLLIGSACSTAWAVSRDLARPMVWRCFLCLVVLSVAIDTPHTLRAAASLRENGLGFTSRRWLDSESIAFAQQSASSLPIYSNGADLLQFRLDRGYWPLPMKTSPNTLEPNEHYPEELQLVCSEIQAGRATLLLLDAIDWRWYLPARAELESSCLLPAPRRFADGAMYGYPSSIPPEGR